MKGLEEECDPEGHTTALVGSTMTMEGVGLTKKITDSWAPSAGGLLLFFSTARMFSTRELRSEAWLLTFPHLGTGAPHSHS